MLKNVDGVVKGQELSERKGKLSFRFIRKDHKEIWCIQEWCKIDINEVYFRISGKKAVKLHEKDNLKIHHVYILF